MKQTKQISFMCCTQTTHKKMETNTHINNVIAEAIQEQQQTHKNEIGQRVIKVYDNRTAVKPCYETALSLEVSDLQRATQRVGDYLTQINAY